MQSFDYKGKIIDFINQINSIIAGNTEASDYNRLTSLLQKMIFYAEQYFIEKGLKNREYPHKIKEIEAEQKQVLARIHEFAECVEKMNAETHNMLAFLTHWKEKLEYEDSLHSS